MISVIVIGKNEEDTLEKCLLSIKQKGVEIIYVDGGSTDESMNIANKHANTIIKGKGKANQLNKGAKRAKGAILLFLHADSIINTQYITKINKAMQDPKIVGGAAKIRFNHPNILFRLIEFNSNNIRPKLTGAYYGDQGIFVRKLEFPGFEGKIMEETRMFSKLKGKTVQINSKIITSPRRFLQNGILLTWMRAFILNCMYYLGASEDKLKRYWK